MMSFALILKRLEALSDLRRTKGIRFERRVLAFNPVTELWKATRKTSFYLSSHPVNANQAGQAICNHWRVELRSTMSPPDYNVYY